MMTHQVRVGVGAIILKSSHEDPTNPRFLIGKRLSAHGAGKYCTPGGHLEFNEGIEACAARETLEETGLVVQGCKFFATTNDIMRGDGKHYITLRVVCRRSDEEQEPRNMEPEKNEGWEWIDWRTLVQMVESDRGAEQVFEPLINMVKECEGALELMMDAAACRT